MGVLKARVGGAWETIVTGSDEVAIAAVDPGAGYELWYDTSDPGASYANLAYVQSGSYTPTLGGGMAVGSGGGAMNTALYTYVGGASVGALGQLVISGRILFGTTGPIAPGNANPDTISLPAGFGLNPAPGLGLTPFGQCNITRNGVSTGPGVLTDHPGNLMRIWAVKTDGTYSILIDPTTNVPIAWSPGDFIDYHATMQASRI
jgi:hypothetical protein